MRNVNPAQSSNTGRPAIRTSEAPCHTIAIFNRKPVPDLAFGPENQHFSVGMHHAKVEIANPPG
jgi:hypothetical protein